MSEMAVEVKDRPTTSNAVQEEMHTDAGEMLSVEDQAKSLKINLDECIENKNNKKNNKKRCESFSDAWVRLAILSGKVTHDLAEYLCNGFTFAKAEPLHRYVKDSKDYKAYESLALDSTFLKNDKHIATKVFLSLFAWELVDPTYPGALDYLVSKISDLNKKAKNRFKAGEAVKQVIAVLKSRTIHEGAIIKSGSADAVIAYLEDALDKHSNAKGATTTSSDLLKWLHRMAGDEVVVGSGSEDAGRHPELKEPEGAVPASSHRERAKVTVVEAADSAATETSLDEWEERLPEASAAPDGAGDQGSDSTPSQEAESESETGNQSIDEAQEDSREQSKPDMRRIISWLAEYQKEQNNLLQKLEEVQEDLELTKRLNETISNERNEAQIAVDKLNKRIEELQYTILDWQERYHSLSSSYSESQSNLSSVRQEMRSLQTGLDEKDALIEMLERQGSRQSGEILKRLAGKLRKEYEDYLAAEDEEMTIDLGENMRAQLGDVFSILMSSGIEL